MDTTSLSLLHTASLVLCIPSLIGIAVGNHFVGGMLLVVNTVVYFLTIS